MKPQTDLALEDVGRVRSGSGDRRSDLVFDPPFAVPWAWGPVCAEYPGFCVPTAENWRWEMSKSAA